MNEDHHDQSDHDHDSDGHTFEGLDRVMGISLVLGFIFMMLVEQIGAYMSSKSNGSIRSNSTGDEESLVHSSGMYQMTIPYLSAKI